MLTMIMRTLVLVLLFVPHFTQAARVQKFDHVNGPIFALGDPPMLFPPRVSPMHILGEELTPPTHPHGEEPSPGARPDGEEPSPAAHPHGEEPSPAAHRSH
ncbi:hypothetical protein CTI12_AA412220 [Artemisia annua]|uniref:Uncharacterized protein n=1 Tax=Artemisia annua TaxID=35608 RepID=A0A2U1M7C4_ARTAN|nr:hypothetical protein CTI12_AA412220 [Artemisia annua]